MITIELERKLYGLTYSEWRGKGLQAPFELCAASVDQLFPKLKNENAITLEVSHAPLEDGYPFVLENYLDRRYGSREYRVTLGSDYDWARRLLLDDTAKYLTRRGYSEGYMRFTYGEYKED